MREKIDKYFELLHPNRAQLSAEEKWYAAGDRNFISENIDKIDKKFQDMVAGSERSGEEINEQEIMKVVFDGVRTDKYIDLLHPNRAQLSAEEKWYAAGNRNFIFENIDKIDRKFQDAIGYAERNGKEIDEQKIMKMIFDGVRTDKYSELLHPEKENFEELSGAEAYNVVSDEQFISENIDKIDRKFQDAIGYAERNGKEIDEHETIKDIIASLKTKQLTTQQIGKATIDSPTATKVEAEQIENTENTKDNLKEGEEVGDDN